MDTGENNALHPPEEPVACESPDAPARRRPLPVKVLFAACAVLVIAAFALSVHYNWDMYSDDAYISFRYAERLATGEGLTWNDGYRVEGYSNFLWVIILAVCRLFGLDIVICAKVLGAVSGAAILLVLYLFTLLATRRPLSFLNLLAPFFHALTVHSHYWMTSGLETSFFAFLALLAVYRFTRERLEPGRAPISSFIFLAAAMTRPEGVMLFAGASVYLLLSKAGRIRKEFLRAFTMRDVIWAVSFVLLYAGFFLLRYAYYGQWLPNTYYAKLGGAHEFGAALSYMGDFFFSHSLLFALVPFAFFLPGRAATVAAVAFSALAAYVAGMLFMGRDWMFYWRIWCHVLPLLFVCMALGAGGALHLILSQKKPFIHYGARRTKRGLLVSWAVRAGFAALVLLGFSGGFAPPAAEIGDALSGNMRPLAMAQEGDLTQHAAKHMAAFIRKNAVPGTLIALNHSGAVPYYSKVDTIDMTGLSDLHIAHLPKRGLHRKYDSDYVLLRRPHFIVLNTHRKPGPRRIVLDYWPGETELHNHPDFKANYVRVPGYWVVNWQNMSSKYAVIYHRKDLQIKAPEWKKD